MRALLVNRRTGKPVPFEWKWIEASELPVVLDLMNRIKEQIHDTTLFVPEDLSTLQRQFRDGGGAIGAYAEGQLICVRTVSEPDRYNHAEGVIHPKYYDAVLHLETVVVAEEYRGNQLQLRSFHFLLAYLKKQKRFLFNSVSPYNTVSLANILKSGAHIVRVQTLYASDEHPEGVLRLICAHGLVLAVGAERRFVRVQDIELQESLLAKGFVGTGMAKGGRILYQKATKTAVPLIKL